jgi:hypothetical protein
VEGFSQNENPYALLEDPNGTIPDWDFGWEGERREGEMERMTNTMRMVPL